jgi:hypothetical protein
MVLPEDAKGRTIKRFSDDVMNSDMKADILLYIFNKKRT